MHHTCTPTPAPPPLQAKHPRLLSASPKDVNLACDALVAVFGEACDPAELAQFIRRAPQLLTYPHQQLSDNHRALLRCLGLPAGRVAALVRRSPRLLQVGGWGRWVEE